jgi:hypothetical protein
MTFQQKHSSFWPERGDLAKSLLSGKTKERSEPWTWLGARPYDRQRPENVVEVELA